MMFLIFYLVGVILCIVLLCIYICKGDLFSHNDYINITLGDVAFLIVIAPMSWVGVFGLLFVLGDDVTVFKIKKKNGKEI